VESTEEHGTAGSSPNEECGIIDQWYVTMYGFFSVIEKACV
jgi:hypothetical protein